MAEWSARLGNDRRPEMNVQERSEVRELTTAEVDEVNGGSIIGNAVKMIVDAAIRITEENNRDTCQVCTYVPCTQ
jgi:hypothetical protein